MTSPPSALLYNQRGLNTSLTPCTGHASSWISRDPAMFFDILWKTPGWLTLRPQKAQESPSRFRRTRHSRLRGQPGPPTARAHLLQYHLQVLQHSTRPIAGHLGQSQPETGPPLVSGGKCVVVFQVSWLCLDCMPCGRPEASLQPLYNKSLPKSLERLL